MRRRVAAGLGLAGGGLLVAAGIVQATLGTVIPDWTGDKLAPVALTVGLGVIALVSARCLRTGSALWALGLVGPGLLSLSTVGRLAWLPAAVLIVATGFAAADGGRDALRVLRAEPVRVLLTVLAATELLMAAGAAPVPMIVGALGGLALLAATWLRRLPRGPRIGLALLGVLPFAGVGWTALVPVLLALVAAPLLVVAVRRPRVG
ncbi:hypothetical protein Psed_6393 [Pseudonocardia dioxanivorans CB1190]|uniref:Uncharacterized protein n=1 Tax=Pseudonocardia dioxanivorans (strain ATCC 55486 / DSM 44775 / JCM 13855 / CB1190) TaxID=675635 RepID=F4CS45_PSEUX|nr:hypothetical protein [Pseudonocardia dioxanivorans]AEA28489.1 hypothetical protein Psed_6393 [Pseudonocardia dioxanivorans CB1190]GJF01952.1 hypothetical protein PSD17_09160 [Pseudonocardia sp. D17]